MKKAILVFSLPIIYLAVLLIFSSFTPATFLNATSTSTAKSHPEEVTITLSKPVGGVRNFTMTGAINATGTWLMQPRSTGKAFHCINTFTATDGSILVAISHCNSITMEGVWQVLSGTGIFSSVEGNGHLVMSPTTGVSERWEGRFR